MLFATDDGDLSYELCRTGACSKIYVATCDCRGPLEPTEEQLSSLMLGVELPDGRSRCQSVTVLGRTSSVVQARQSKEAEAAAAVAVAAGGEGGASGTAAKVEKKKKPGAKRRDEVRAAKRQRRQARLEERQQREAEAQREGGRDGDDGEQHGGEGFEENADQSITISIISHKIS